MQEQYNGEKFPGLLSSKWDTAIDVTKATPSTIHNPSHSFIYNPFWVYCSSPCTTAITHLFPVS